LAEVLAKAKPGNPMITKKTKTPSAPINFLLIKESIGLN
jgi:hypothetical protein